MTYQDKMYDIYDKFYRNILTLVNNDYAFYLFNDNNITRKYQGNFTVSFDIDLDADASALYVTIPRLKKLGINPCLAVIGSLLEKNPHPYVFAVENGCEIINHGHSEHTFFNTSTKEITSPFCYSKMELGQIEYEIKTNHEVIYKYLNVEPIGFRTPHFASFQKKRNLDVLYSIISKMGYHYSSSTSNYGCYKNSLIESIEKNNFFEIPMICSYSRPWAIFDSWSLKYIRQVKGKNSILPNEFNSLIEKIKNGYFNFYMDPRDIYDDELFYDNCKKLSQSRKHVQYRELLR